MNYEQAITVLERCELVADVSGQAETAEALHMAILALQTEAHFFAELDTLLRAHSPEARAERAADEEARVLAREAQYEQFLGNDVAHDALPWFGGDND